MDKMKDESSNTKKKNDNNVPDAIPITDNPIFDFLIHPEINCFLLKTLISLTKEIETEKERAFLDKIGKTILSGAKNPCIMNQKELSEMRLYRPKEKEAIYKLNDEFNNAESLEEIENCLEKAERDSIAVREEYVAFFHFVNDLKNLKESFESIGGNTQNLFASAIRAMLSSFDLAEIECSLEYQEKTNKNFRDHNTEKENRLLIQIAAFQEYLLEIEAYWSSKKMKRVFNFELACKHVFNEHMEKNDETLKMLFNSCYAIDCTKPENKKECIKKLKELTMEYRNRFLAKRPDYENKPQKRKPRSDESRKNSSEGQKRAIEQKKNKSSE